MSSYLPWHHHESHSEEKKSVGGEPSATLEENNALPSSHHHNDLDLIEEKKLVRKLDLHIVPVVMLLYLLSFLDRSVFAISLSLSLACVWCA